jgi:catechol 2,3-dioxygenase-like lactoylglutathione lyase family enzyme
MLLSRRVHTTLPTADPERLRTFYETTLGFVPFAERPGAVIYQAGDGSLFALSKAGGRPTGAHTQMAFTVPDIESEVAELRRRGVVFEDYETPRTTDGIGRVGSGRAAWFKDPEGNLIGIIEFDDPV